ncbi:PelA/Pel-15E family pectate lyase [Sphingomonas kyeonggiensis]|uniref:PelA/Pel-15E family pectate lyase n=1 Tax=Sphingomonas kyeonggiensis TaxID=1268553 RepID=A0A7W7K3Q7_9SPHN|nr:pectate lyase [Sphingomonas kyeonggiensis]MBB4840058.1 PelA/Pel-15E family pectate lyase [Sphingomonas kyeonggiensis]
MIRIAKIALFAAAAMTPVAYAAVEVIGKMTPAEPITHARIATLPIGQQRAWNVYLDKSVGLMEADKAALAAERADGTLPTPVSPPTGPSGGSGMPLDKPAGWYAGADARHVADNIVSFQTPAGGWGKNVDRTGPVRARGEHYVPIEKLPANAKSDMSDENWSYVGTIDNNATTTELRFLARAQAAAPGAEGNAYRESFLKGIRYLLNAQFPNGGWPQVYPLQGGYHDALTFNDDALSSVVGVLAEVARHQGDYAFVSDQLALEAKAACNKAIQLILKTQVVIDGKRTVWGQQHDALTLAPAGARNFEPVALSSDESADLLVFLMKQAGRSPSVDAAVADGVNWLKAHAIHGFVFEKGPDGRKLVAKPGAGPIWSRYYDIQTGKPIFGDRDRTIHTDVNELSAERRNGYSWYNNGPAKALATYDKWVAKK